MDVVLETKGLCKSFGDAKANDNINLKLHRGEIMAVLGENGSGKTTLINMLAGTYYPDSGEIFYNGKKVCIRSPKDADRLGIGVVHQHFQLVSEMSATENIEIALPDKSFKNKAEVRQKISDIAKQYGFRINPDKRVCEMSVSEKQTVEIIKALIKGAELLILDEPTAVLTPQESRSLFEVLRAMRSGGKSIIIITHKLQEVLDISDTVYIMRKGKYVDEISTKDTDEQELACKMVGKTVALKIERTKYSNSKKVLELDNVSCLSDDKTQGLKNISFELYSGEILGVAGISGSGQRELCESIAGIRDTTGGSIKYYSEEGIFDLTNKDTEWRNKRKISFGYVPEDRLGMGLIASSDMVDNMLLKNYKNSAGAFLNRKKAFETAEYLMKRLQIAAPGVNTPVRLLSGGNVQKVLLGRELEQSRDVLIVSYPVRGLDINSSYTVYSLLNEERKKGTAVIFVGEDLDVLMSISDRIMVLADGELTGIIDAENAQKDFIGSLMTGCAAQEREDVSHER